MEYRGELIVNGVIVPIITNVNGTPSKTMGMNYGKSTRPQQVVQDVIRRSSIPLNYHCVVVLNKDGDVWQYVGQKNKLGQSVGRLEKLNVVLPHDYVIRAFSGVTPISKLLSR